MDATTHNMIFIERSLVDLCRVDAEFFVPLSHYMLAIDRDDDIPDEVFYTAGHIARNGFRAGITALRAYFKCAVTGDLDDDVLAMARVLEMLLSKYGVRTLMMPETNDTISATTPVPAIADRKGAKMNIGRFPTNDRNADLNDLVAVLNAKRANMHEDAIKEVEECLVQTSQMKKSETEYLKNYQFLRTVAKLPFGVVSEDNTNVEEIERILNESHYGLDEAKERITEFLAISTMKKDAEAPKFMMLGAPGTGKTSLAQAMGKALGRKVQRVALGGVSDASTIKGHRRTYVGSVHGRIIDAILKAGVDNPIIILDEMDKLVTGQGDPQGALLELLDKEQNHAFTDFYLNFPYDMSKVIFVCTANYADRIDGALFDRLELIEIAGYNLKEKLTIARDYVLPQTEEANGLERGSVKVSKDTLKYMVDGYTREAGLRRLQQALNKLVRKVAVEVSKGKKAPSITKKFVEKHMGQRYFEPEVALAHDVPGLMHGLYYSTAGGGALPMEAILNSDAGTLSMTGQAGDVMIESIQIAYGFVRSRSIGLGLDPDIVTDAGIQVHMPDGSTPKDGPSAGLAFVTLIASVLSGRCVKDGLAMTGEVTLHGFAKAIGGVYEKVTGGLRDGIKEFILPEENRRDYEELPKSVKDAAKFHLVKNAFEVLEIALDMQYDPNRYEAYDDADDGEVAVMTA